MYPLVPLQGPKNVPSWCYLKNLLHMNHAQKARISAKIQKTQPELRRVVGKVGIIETKDRIPRNWNQATPNRIDAHA